MRTLIVMEITTVGGPDQLQYRAALVLQGFGGMRSRLLCQVLPSILRSAPLPMTQVNPVADSQLRRKCVLLGRAVVPTHPVAILIY